MPMEYIVPSLCIAATIGMNDETVVEERLEQLLQLKEDRFITNFHQQVGNDRQKEWNDIYVKEK